MATKTAQPKFNKTDLKKMAVPLPPVRERQEISGHLSAVDAKISAEEKVRAALENVLQSAMHQLITGKVRVPEV